MSLADRPAAGLYAAAWALCGLGLAALFISSQFRPPFGDLTAFAAFLTIVVGLTSAAGQQLLARRGRPAAAYRGPSPLLLLALDVAFLYAIARLTRVLGITLAFDTPGFLVEAILLVAGYVLVVWLFVIRSGASSWRELIRAEPLDAGRVLVDIAIGGVTMFGAAIVAGILANVLSYLLGGTQPPQVLPTPKTSADVVMVALAAGLLVPIGEEVFFRGFAVTAWLRDLGPRTALIRATLFFALVHLLNITSATFEDGVKQAILELAVIGPIGFALGWLYLRRGLVASIGGHAAFNLFGILVIVLTQYLPQQGPTG